MNEAISVFMNAKKTFMNLNFRFLPSSRAPFARVRLLPDPAPTDRPNDPGMRR